MRGVTEHGVPGTTPGLVLEETVGKEVGIDGTRMGGLPAFDIPEVGGGPRGCSALLGDGGGGDLDSRDGVFVGSAGRA